jgi:hypothetical protein
MDFAIHKDVLARAVLAAAFANVETVADAAVIATFKQGVGFPRVFALVVATLVVVVSTRVLGDLLYLGGEGSELTHHDLGGKGLGGGGGPLARSIFQVLVLNAESIKNRSETECLLALLLYGAHDAVVVGAVGAEKHDDVVRGTLLQLHRRLLEPLADRPITLVDLQECLLVFHGVTTERLELGDIKQRHAEFSLLLSRDATKFVLKVLEGGAANRRMVVRGILVLLGLAVLSVGAELGDQAVLTGGQTTEDCVHEYLVNTAMEDAIFFGELDVAGVEQDRFVESINKVVVGEAGVLRNGKHTEACNKSTLEAEPALISEDGGLGFMFGGHDGKRCLTRCCRGQRTAKRTWRAVGDRGRPK